MSKFSRITFKFLDLVIIFMMVFGSPMSALAQDATPTDTPTEVPIATDTPTATDAPTAAPTEPPTQAPTEPPIVTEPPTATEPTTATEPPTTAPTDTPTTEPTVAPTDTPTPLPAPTIQSDKADYAPGELVTLTGADWQGDTTVTITVVDAVPTVYHDTDKVTVQADGTISDSFNLPTSFVDRYYVTAKGAQTGRVATTDFTDSQEDYKHYADMAPAKWQNGALQSTNSQYFEGEVVPHYWKTESLTPGLTYGINIYYDYYDSSSGGYCGFDYMAQYNINRNPPPVGSSPYPIYSIPGGPGALYTVGAGNVSTSGPYTDGSGIQRFIQVRFLATTSKVEFYWGLHLAQPGAISGCQGAKAWPGASLQSDVRATPQFTQYMLGGGGSMQINPSGVLRGVISGLKWNDQDGDGVVDGNESKLSSWPIRLCYDSGCTGIIQTTTTDASGNYNFNIAPGTYFVREVLQSGWLQTYPASGYYGPLTINATTPTYSNINFGNRQSNSITIIKDAIPDDPQDFQFFGTFGNFLLDDDSDPMLSNSKVFSNLSPGAYTVGESVTGSWTLAGVKCTGDNGNTVIPPGSNQVQIILDPGESITCTFTNNKQTGTITIIKDATPDDTQDFPFGGDLGSFSLDDDSDPTLSNTKTFTNVSVGTYRVGEGPMPTGWDLTSVKCTDPDNGSTISGGVAYIDLDSGETVTCTFNNTKQAPALTLAKTATPGTYGAVGDVISYSYLVTNTGNVTLPGPVTVTDDKAAVTCGVNPSINPADVVLFDHFQNSYLAQYTSGSPTYVNGPISLGQALDFTSGAWLRYDVPGWYQWTNAYDPAGKEGSIDLWVYPKKYDIVLVNFNWNSTTSVPPAGHILSLVIDSNGKLTSGQWSAITGPTLTPMSAGSAIIPLNQWTHVAYTWGSGGSRLFVNGVQDAFSPDNLYPALNPTFYVYVPSWGVPGIGYIDEFRITNHAQSGFINALAPGSSTTCTANYTITQADLNAGSVKNTAQAHANGVDSNTDSETVTATQTRALSLVKTAKPATYSAVGDVISYSYVVKNTGNVTLAGPVTVTDDKATVSCSAGGLAPGASMTCTASYTITQADLNAGSVTNVAQAHASGTDSNTDTETVTAVQSRALTLVKSATPSTYDAAGDTISYSYLVTNSGNVTLYGISVVDDKASVSCQDTSAGLAPEDFITCTASYTIGQGDLDAGAVTNTAYATDGTTQSEPDSETVTAEQSPALSLVKTATPDTYDSVGDAISYSYLVTNTGNITLMGPVTLTDDKATVTCPAGGLAPLASMTCTASYTVAQTDLDAGFVKNTAQAHANGTNSNFDDETVTADQMPALTIDKTASPATYNAVDDIISYTYLVTNSGNVTLYDITVVDDKATVSCTAEAAAMLPGAKVTCTASYIIAQADLDAGSVTNSAYATDGTTQSEPDSETVNAEQMPAIEVTKSGTFMDENGDDYADVGETISYTFTVKNTGNVTLYNVVITDPKVTVTGGPLASLAVGVTDSITFTASYSITQADIDFGSVYNMATACGYDAQEDEACDDGDNTVTLPQYPALSIVKTGAWVDGDADGYADAGEVINYTFTVKNEGNVTLHNVTVTDPKVTIVGGPTTLDVGETDTTTFTGSYTLTQADIDAGKVDNTAIADSNESGPASDDETVTLPQNPALSLEKTGSFDAGQDSYADPGELITYTFVVTNTGNVTLTNLTVSDPKVSPITCDATTVLVDGFVTCTGTYAVTQADIDAGSVYNLATADSDEAEPDDDSETVPLPQNDAFTVVKTANPESMAEPGGPATFTVIVNNTGNTTLALTALDDDVYGNIADDTNADLNSTTCSVPQSILVDASYECTFNADVTGEPGFYTDTVMATANNVTGSDDATVELTDVKPTIAVDKTANPTSMPEPGGDVEFTVVVTNNSFEPVTLTSLTDDVYSDLNGQGTCASGGTIAAGSTYTCTFIGVVSGEPGFYTDTVTAVITDNDGSTDSGDDTATVELTDVAPTVSLTKTADPVTLPEPGGVFTFTLSITNTSVETVTITALTDDSALSQECKDLVGTTLAAGASTSCSYTVTHTEAGSYDNTASATVADNEENEASASDDETVTVTDVLPTVTIDKTASSTTLPEPGGTFTFTLTITNTSVENVTITGLGDTNTLSPENSPECLALVHTTLTPGESVSCQYDVTHTDAGTYPNRAEVTVADNEGNPAGDTDDETVTVTDVLPTVMIEKTASPTTLPEPGGVFTFTLKITNTSVENVTITGLGDTNTLSPENSPACLALVHTTLTPEESVSCQYNVTHTDAGTYPNTGEVTVADNEGNPAGDTDDETVTVTDILPTVDLTKAVTPSTLPEPGGVFTYTLTITNNSVETVKITALTDNNSLSAECTALVDTFLDPSESASCIYTVTHTEAGTYLNTADVTVKDNEDNNASDSDSETVTVTDVKPEIMVEKSANPTSVPETGGDVIFTFVVTNKSVEAVTLTSLSDSVFVSLAGDNDCEVGTILPVDGSCTFSEVHLIKGDFESGTNHTNVFTAHAEDNEKNDTSATDDAAVTFTDVSADIAIAKVTVDGTTTADAINILTGEAIKWRYTVTNAGTYPLSNVAVTDSQSGVTPAYVSGDDGDNLLETGESWIFEASGTAITGSYSNTATAYGDFTDGADNIESDTATDGSSYFGADPQISIDKVTVDGSAEGDGLNILTGEPIGWKYTVTNTGNVVLTNVTVTDSKAGVTVTCSKTTLVVDESMTCTATGTALTGNYTNTGTASGSYTDTAGHSRTDTATNTSSYFGANPQIDIVKKTVGSDGTEGDNVFILTGAAVTWKYYVTNTGNVALSNVAVTDNKLGVIVTCPKTSLALGESMTCTATGTNSTPLGTWYNNTGTANGSYTDSAGHSKTATDSDSSAYYSGNPGLVTNSSLCDFGESFRLIFTPDVKYYTSSLQAYKLSDSNPGQFFYNVFQTGGTGTVTLTLPYPFVTQGATPIHVYSSLTAAQNNDQTCLQPTNEIKNYQQIVTLSNYPVNTYNSTTRVTLTGLPTSGFMYINIHLDYGLEKLNGWVKNGANANYNLTINPTMPKVNIVDQTTHTFTSSIPNSTDSIKNTNEFKKVKGFGGLVYMWNATLGEYVPLNAAKVRLFKGTATTGTGIETMTADGDGWYLSTYVHTGKAATYTLALLNGSGPSILKKITVTAGGSVKFGEGIFYIGGPTPTP